MPAVNVARNFRDSDQSGNTAPARFFHAVFAQLPNRADVIAEDYFYDMGIRYMTLTGEAGIVWHPPVHEGPGWTQRAAVAERPALETLRPRLSTARPVDRNIEQSGCQGRERWDRAGKRPIPWRLPVRPSGVWRVFGDHRDGGGISGRIVDNLTRSERLMAASRRTGDGRR